MWRNEEAKQTLRKEARKAKALSRSQKCREQPNNLLECISVCVYIQMCVCVHFVYRYTHIRVWDGIEMCFGCARKRLDNDKVKTQTLKEKEKVDKRKRMTDGSAEGKGATGG